MTGLTMLFVGRTLKTLGLWTRKAVEHFKQTLIGHSSGSTEASAEGDLNYRGPVQEVSEGKNFSKWPSDHSWNILVKSSFFQPLST